MKKLLLTAVLLLAIASFGGNALYAHAAGTPTGDQATLQQTLDVTKAQLVQLEMQQGLVPQGDGGELAAAMTSEGSATLSAGDKAAISTALGSLASALSNLQSELIANPSLADQQSATIVAELKGIGDTLATISVAIATPSTAPVVAIANPAPVSAPTPAPVKAPANDTIVPSVTASGPISVSVTPANGSAVTPSVTTDVTPAVSPSAPTPAAASANTAQASSIVDFAKSHWPTLTIILLIVLMLIILFWPHEEDGKPAPQMPNRNPGPARQTNQSSQSATVVRTTVPAGAPAATQIPTMGQTPMQRMEVQQAKVTVIRPPEPKKKTA